MVAAGMCTPAVAQANPTPGPDVPPHPSAAPPVVEHTRTVDTTLTRGLPTTHKVRITKIKLSRDAKSLQVRIVWDKALLKKAGKHDDLDLRALVKGASGGWKLVAANPGSIRLTSGNVSNLTFPIKRKTTIRLLKTATEAVVTATQSWDSPKDKDHKYEVSAVSVVHGQRKAAVTRATDVNDAGAAWTWQRQMAGTPLFNLPVNCAGYLSAYGDYSHCDLTGAALDGASLPHSNFFMAKLDGSHLAGADLSYSELGEVAASNSDLRGVNLSHSSIGGIISQSSDYSGADLSAVDAYDGHPHMANSTFEKANLTGAKLPYLEAPNSDFTGADLSNAVIYQSDLRNAWLNSDDVTLGPTNLTLTDFDYANLSGANLRGRSWADSKTAYINRTNFWGATLDDADFGYAVISQLKSDGTYGSFQSASLRRTTFFGAVLHSQDGSRGVPYFWGADLRETDFGLATLDGGPDFSSANLTGALWGGAKVSTVITDMNTYGCAAIPALKTTTCAS